MNHLLEPFLHLSPALFALADPNTGEFTWLSPRWEDVLGWPIEEMLGRPFMDFVHMDDVSATAPVPNSDEDPMWEIYDTWLLDFIGTEMANGVFDRVGEFVMTIAMVNPPLANQLVPKVLERATLLDVDSVAKSLVKGGAIDLEQPIVHPALSELDAKVIDELRDALLTGWKTNEDRVLAKYHKDL